MYIIVYEWFCKDLFILIIHTVQNYTFPERNRNTCTEWYTSICIQITCKLQMFDDALLSVVNWFMYQTLFSLLLHTNRHSHEFNT